MKLVDELVFGITLFIYLGLLIYGALENILQLELLGGFLMIYNFLVLLAFK